MIRFFLFILFIHISVRNNHAQIVLYQDIFKGGVTGDAYNAGFSFTFGQVDIYIEPGSTIRKALLFVNSYYNPLDERTLYFNGVPLHINQSFAVNDPYYYLGNTTGSSREIRTIVLDVTQLVNPLQSSYSITPPPAIFPITTMGAYIEYYLYVAYDNPLLDKVCAIAAVNNVQPNAVMNYFFHNLNTMDTTQNVALSIHTSHFCDTIQDGSYVLIEGDTIGLIGGDDNHSLVSCTGVVGSFYYQNSTLFGLGNDIASITMAGPDAIANIESYLNSTTEIDLSFRYQSNFGPQTNPVHQLFLTYTTPCDTFLATVTSDTIACSGQPLQLQATGGQAYEWLPQIGLSCYNCPSPVFQHDSTMNYTVRIWNTDSCSKVLPMRVRVLPPVTSTAAVTNSDCEQPTGSIALLPASGGAPPYSYSINNQPGSSNPNFNALAAGIYTLQITDSGGCTWNDTVVVDKNTLAQAAFTATPATGFTPLIVQFTNQSTGAAHAIWTTNGHTAHTWNYQHIYDQEGSYPVTLVVWNTDSLCSDTASFTILAQNEMAIVVPALWNIGILPQYSLHTTSVKHLRFRLFDVTGRMVIDHELHEPVGQIEIPMSFANLTRPATAAYLYRIDATGLQGEQKVFTGKLVVVR